MPRPVAPDVKVVHFADPWCWWSWGLEPVLQRLREVYGDRLQVEYRMGGTFEDLDAWMKEYAVDEASAVDWIRESMALFKNALDPEYLRKSGVRSTYPACLAFKAAQRQDEHKAKKFFRRMMDAFEEDRRMMERSRANFLTLVVTAGGKTEAKSEVFTSGPFEEVIDRLRPGLPKRAPTDILEYLEKHGDLTPVHEVAEVFRIGEDDADRRLVGLEKAGLLDRFEWAGARLWTARKLAMDKL